MNYPFTEDYTCPKPAALDQQAINKKQHWNRQAPDRPAINQNQRSNKNSHSRGNMSITASQVQSGSKDTPVTLLTIISSLNHTTSQAQVLITRNIPNGAPDATQQQRRGWAT
jgi:hypothetical protein